MTHGKASKRKFYSHNVEQVSQQQPQPQQPAIESNTDDSYENCENNETTNEGNSSGNGFITSKYCLCVYY